jgi:hypothetical protein
VTICAFRKFTEYTTVLLRTLKKNMKKKEYEEKSEEEDK